MNAKQRRKYRRSLPVVNGCQRLGYSGTTRYPDLMCTDGYMTDMDADGYDPTTSRLPCRDCNPVEYAEWMREEEEDSLDGDAAVFAHYGL